MKFIYFITCMFIFVNTANSLAVEFYEKDGKMLCDIDGGEPCRLNEACLAKNESDRIGYCECVDGMVRNATNHCVSDMREEATTTTSDASDNSTQIVAADALFTIDGPSSVQLPTKSATLRVLMKDNKIKTGAFSYHWEMIEGTGSATAATYNKPSLWLKNLSEGRLVFRVTVSNSTFSDSRQFVLSVLPKMIANRPPHAVILPESPISATEGSQVVLDAEGSSDDMKIASYHWSQDQGPSVTLPSMDTAILRLDHLVKGEYQFTVVVTDSSGLSSNTSARVIVSAERDDPPKAHISQCGHSDTGSITVRLPVSQILLCGNASSDDKGIKNYSWYRVDKLAGKLPVDSSGSASSVLTLTNVQANDQIGPYQYQLDVTDTKGQKDSTKINIFVNKAENMPPEVNAGGNHTVFLPETSFVLDGNVKDDGSVISYSWEQVDGPVDTVITNGDKAKATVMGLIEGEFTFRLSVTDDGGLNASSDATLSVQRSQNDPPVARALNVTIRLPSSIAILNGSQSSDDAGIVSYEWKPFDDVPAAMTALDGSDTRSIMYVTGLVKGTHYYTLTVKDQQKATGSLVVQLVVQQGDEDTESLELIIDRPLSNWTYRMRTKLGSRLAAVLAGALQEFDEVDVNFAKFEEVPRDGRIRVVFWAQTDVKAVEMRRRRSLITSSGVIRAVDVIRILSEERSMMHEFDIVKIQPLYCKLDCSGHGICSDSTKECVCDRFWMSSLFSLMTNEWQHVDCAWSLVYVWLISIGIVVIVTVCILLRKRSSAWGRVARRKLRRRQRYTALNTDSDEEVARIRNQPRLKPLPLPPSSDSMMSEDSDDMFHGDNSWEMDARTSLSPPTQD